VKLNKLVLSYGIIWACLGVSSTIYYGNKISDVELIQHILISYALSALIIWAVTAIGSIWRHYLWKRKGYDDVLIFIYPLVIEFSGGTHLNKILTPLDMWTFITPSQYHYNLNHESPWADHLAYKIECNTFWFQIGIFVFIASGSIYFSTIDTVLASFGALLGFVATGFVKDEIYNGKITTLMLLKAGAISEFVLNSTIIYETDVDVFNHMKSYIIEEIDQNWRLNHLRLLTYKFMLIIACAYKKKLDGAILQHIETKVIIPFKLGHLFFDREALEIIKLHMYYCVIHDDDERKVVSLNKLFELTDYKRDDISNRMKDEFERYINIGQNRRINDNPIFKRDLVLIKKDIPYSSFNHYREVVSAAEEALYSKCTIRSKIIGSHFG
jgi:hypothetical protein